MISGTGNGSMGFFFGMGMDELMGNLYLVYTSYITRGIHGTPSEAYSVCSFKERGRWSAFFFFGFMYGYQELSLMLTGYGLLEGMLRNEREEREGPSPERNKKQQE